MYRTSCFTCTVFVFHRAPRHRSPDVGLARLEASAPARCLMNGCNCDMLQPPTQLHACFNSDLLLVWTIHVNPSRGELSCTSYNGTVHWAHANCVRYGTCTVLGLKGPGTREKLCTDHLRSKKVVSRLSFFRSLQVASSIMHPGSWLTS